MSAVETLRDALFGNPPSPTTKPSREGALAAFTELERQTVAAGMGLALIRNQADTSYTLQQSDNGYIVNFTSGTAVTVTVPPGLTIPFTVGISQGGLGQVSLVEGAGVDIAATDGAVTTETQGVLCPLIAFNEDEYRFYGRLV